VYNVSFKISQQFPTETEENHMKIARYQLRTLCTSVRRITIMLKTDNKLIFSVLTYN